VCHGWLAHPCGPHEFGGGHFDSPEARFRFVTDGSEWNLEKRRSARMGKPSVARKRKKGRIHAPRFSLLIMRSVRTIRAAGAIPLR
jgi:hypothetical protein